jgi:dihydroflavonol-4-reductase
MIGVTGANGFLGFHLVRHLHDRGAPVCALVRRSRPELQALGIPIRAFDELDGVESIAHVAGTFAMHGAFRETMTEANVRTTERLLASGKRIVLCSSSITIGFGPREAPGNEDTPLDPRVYGDGPLRAYCETKLAAEALVLGAGGTVVNPDFVVGAYDFGPTSGGLLLMLARGRLPFWPRGVKCFQAVGDCVAGMAAAIDRGGRGRRYFLGGENLPYRTFLEMGAEALGVRAPRLPLPHELAARVAAIDPTGRLPSPDVIRAMALERYRDGSRARAELGVPSTPIRDAIGEALRWFRDQGWC